MGDNLDGLAQVIAPALLVNDALVNSSGGNIVSPCGIDVCEALIVPEVKVSLMTVNSHIAFSMLVRVQCSGIYIDIWVKFLDSDAIAARFE